MAYNCELLGTPFPDFLRERLFSVPEEPKSTSVLEILPCELAAEIAKLCPPSVLRTLSSFSALFYSVLADKRFQKAYCSENLQRVEDTEPVPQCQYYEPARKHPGHFHHKLFDEKWGLYCVFISVKENYPCLFDLEVGFYAAPKEPSKNGESLKVGPFERSNEMLMVEKGQYTEGKLSGKLVSHHSAFYTHFNVPGDIEEAECEDGLLHGYFARKSEQGRIYWHGRYHKGKLHGVSRGYSEDKIIEEVHEHGVLKESGTLPLTTENAWVLPE